MPDKVIDIPGHGSIAFPDSMSDQEINAAATRLYQQANPEKKQPPVKSWVDTAVDWLPAVAGAAGGIIGGIGGTVAGMGVGGVPGAVGGAAVGGAGGEAAKQLINRARGKGGPETMGQAATDIAGQGALQGGAELAGAGVGAVMSAAAPRLMQTAVKPTLGMLKDVMQGAEVPRIVKTLLDEGVNVTPAGYQKLHALLNTTTAERNAMIAEATAGGAPGVNPYAAASRLSDTAKAFGNQVNPTADLEAIGKAGNEFLAEHGGARIPLQAANELKQGTYQVLKKKYGQLGSADIEAQKALARGLKEEIERQAPGVGTANERISALMDASKAVGRRVAVSENRDPVGFAWVAHNPTTFLAALLDRSPAVKSMLARGLYQSAGAAARVSPQLIRMAVTALAAGDDSGSSNGPTGQ